MGIYDTRTACKQCARCVPVNRYGVCADCRGEPSDAEVVAHMQEERDRWIWLEQESWRKEQRLREEIDRERKIACPYKTFVYVARVPSWPDKITKIGYSGVSVKSRLKAQYLEALFVLNTDNGRKLEKAIHKEFANCRIYRTEHFFLDDRHIDYLKGLTELDGGPIKVITKATELYYFVP